MFAQQASTLRRLPPRQGRSKPPSRRLRRNHKPWSRRPARRSAAAPRLQRLAPATLLDQPPWRAETSPPSAAAYRLASSEAVHCAYCACRTAGNDVAVGEDGLLSCETAGLTVSKSKKRQRRLRCSSQYAGFSGDCGVEWRTSAVPPAVAESAGPPSTDLLRARNNAQMTAYVASHTSPGKYCYRM